VPLHTDLLEKWEFQLISMMELELTDVIVESLSLTKAQRMNRNTV
jgi:hypothetical protein